MGLICYISISITAVVLYQSTEIFRRTANLNKQLMILPSKWLITSSGNPPGPAGTGQKVWYTTGAGVPSTTTCAWLMSHLSQEKLKQLSVCCGSTSPWEPPARLCVIPGFLWACAHIIRAALTDTFKLPLIPQIHRMHGKPEYSRFKNLYNSTALLKG